MGERYPTPHINAAPKDFAKTVLMPGDPLRAQFIAEKFLENPKLINDVRGIKGYTGTYKGVPVSVMGSGMGMPSIGIYSYELYNIFGVENIFRVGSSGGINEKVGLKSIIAAMGACTDSNYASQYDLCGTFAPIADYRMLKLCDETAKELGINLTVGNICSSDVFYKDDPSDTMKWSKMGVLAEEMEAAALYMNAARAGKRALCVCTVSDDLLKNEHMSSEERRTSLEEMIRLVLETAIKL